MKLSTESIRSELATGGSVNSEVNYGVTLQLIKIIGVGGKTLISS